MVVFNFQDFLISFGYLAVFLLTLARAVGLFQIALPIPQMVIIGSAVGIGLDPFIVGILAGLASTIGDSVGYFVGLGSGKIITRFKKIKIPKEAVKLKKFMNKRGFWIILAVGLTPLPFDLFGIASGLAHYDLRKFLLASLISKVGGSFLVAYGVLYGIDIIKGLG